MSCKYMKEYMNLYDELNDVFHKCLPLNLPITYQLTYYLTLISDIKANLGLSIIESYENRAQLCMKLRDIFVCNRNVFLEYISIKMYNYIKQLLEQLLCRSMYLVMRFIDENQKGESTHTHPYTDFVEKLYRLPSNSYNVWIVSWLVSCINDKHFYTIDILRNINWANLICKINSFLKLIPSIRKMLHAHTQGGDTKNE